MPRLEACSTTMPWFGEYWRPLGVMGHSLGHSRTRLRGRGEMLGKKKEVGR